MLDSNKLPLDSGLSSPKGILSLVVASGSSNFDL